MLNQTSNRKWKCLKIEIISSEKQAFLKKKETLKHALLEIKSRQLNLRGMEKIVREVKTKITSLCVTVSEIIRIQLNCINYFFSRLFRVDEPFRDGRRR